MRKTTCLLFTVLPAAFCASQANDTTVRIERAATVLKTLTSSADGIPPETLAASDCIAVVPGFKEAPLLSALPSERDSSPAGLLVAGRLLVPLRSKRRASVCS